MRDPTNLLGQKINQLTVVSIERIEQTTEKNGTRYRYFYKCLCDCGNYTVVFHKTLLAKKAISCGCARKNSVGKPRNTKQKVLGVLCKRNHKHAVVYDDIGNATFMSLRNSVSHLCIECTNEYDNKKKGIKQSKNVASRFDALVPISYGPLCKNSHDTGNGQSIYYVNGTCVNCDNVSQTKQLRDYRNKIKTRDVYGIKLGPLCHYGHNINRQGIGYAESIYKYDKSWRCAVCCWYEDVLHTEINKIDVDYKNKQIKRHHTNDKSHTIKLKDEKYTDLYQTKTNNDQKFGSPCVYGHQNENGKNLRTKQGICLECRRIRQRIRDQTIESKLRSRLRAAFKRFSITGKVKPSRQYGIDYEKIAEHIGPKPDPINGISYDIDHIVPLSAFDFDNNENVKVAFSPENHQWLLSTENDKKSSKIPTIDEVPQNARWIVEYISKKQTCS